MRSELQEGQAYDYGSNTGSPRKDTVDSYERLFAFETECYMSRDNPVPNSPNSYEDYVQLGRSYIRGAGAIGQFISQ